MPSRLVCRIAVAALFSAGSGCTLLIPFDEVAVATDAGADSQTPPDMADARRSDGDSIAPPSDGGAPDATNYDACVGHPNGQYCGLDQIPWPNKDDQVTCASNKVAAVRHCMTGQGCLGMLNGYPDECDDCATKADGTYCGRDFPAWQPENAEQRVRCQSGREVGLLLCTTCKSNGTASACE